MKSVVECLSRFAAALGASSLFIAALVIIAPSPAYAVPKWTSFKEAIAASETIVIVRLDKLPPRADQNAPKATLEVIEVLKGNLKPGKLKVGFEDYPEGAPDEFIAFLDKNHIWRFTAKPLAGKKVASDLLEMEGFSDFNAHIVSPGLITLKQLETYLKEGALRYSIEGPIWFPQRGNPVWKVSGLRIKLTYDAVKKQAQVTGLPKLAGFAAEPTVRIENYHFRRLIDLTYGIRSDRPLEFRGWIESLDLKSGSMLAQFVVTNPETLDANGLQKYCADARQRRCYYKFRLHCVANPQYPKLKNLVFNMDWEVGTKGALDGWDGGPLEIFRWETVGPKDAQESIGPEVPAAAIDKAFAERWVFRVLLVSKTKQYVLLTFDMGSPTTDPGSFGWPFKNDLLYRVYSAPVRGTLQFYDGKEWHRVTTFKVELEPVQFGTAR